MESQEFHLEYSSVDFLLSHSTFDSVDRLEEWERQSCRNSFPKLIRMWRILGFQNWLFPIQYCFNLKMVFFSSSSPSLVLSACVRLMSIEIVCVPCAWYCTRKSLSFTHPMLSHFRHSIRCFDNSFFFLRHSFDIPYFYYWLLPLCQFNLIACQKQIWWHSTMLWHELEFFFLFLYAFYVSIQIEWKIHSYLSQNENIGFCGSCVAFVQRFKYCAILFSFDWLNNEIELKRTEKKKTNQRKWMKERKHATKSYTTKNWLPK